MARVEERLAWLERHMTEQDKVMLELTETLDRLRREAEVLRRRVGDGINLHPQEEERPPHY
ncbi:SlyX family protein [Termitidicoccus mucosus]